MRPLWRSFGGPGCCFAGRRRCGALPGSGMVTLLPPSIPAWCLSGSPRAWPGPLACFARLLCLPVLARAVRCFLARLGLGSGRWCHGPACPVCLSWHELLCLPGSPWLGQAAGRSGPRAAEQGDPADARPHGMAHTQPVPALASSARLLRGPFHVSSARAWPSPGTARAWPSPGTAKPGPCLTQPEHGQACSAWPPARGAAVTTGLTSLVHAASGTSGTEDYIERPMTSVSAYLVRQQCWVNRFQAIPISPRSPSVSTGC
jgi:hypothetical protein